MGCACSRESVRGGEWRGVHRQSWRGEGRRRRATREAGMIREGDGILCQRRERQENKWGTY